MSMLKKTRLLCEAPLVHLGLFVLPALPRGTILALARLCGNIAYACAGTLRRVALVNLDLAFGATLTPATKRRIARQAFRTMALTMLDLFWFARDTASRLKRYVAIDDSMRVVDAIRPVVGATAHYGNWELLAQALAAAGYEHAAVAAPLANPVVERIFLRRRNMAGVEIIPQKGAIRGLLKALRKGKHIALLLDQNTKPEAGGVFVKLFGLPIPMSSSAAVLAVRTGRPIFVLFCRARPDGTYFIFGLPPIRPSDNTGVNAPLVLTQAIAKAFEDEIRHDPGQWLWMYKRWKYVAPGMPHEAYPFYAKYLSQ